MEITIGNLKITNFCKENVEHIEFKKDMLDDGLMYYYFPNLNENNFLLPSSTDEELKINNFYLVKDIDKIIGWIFLSGFEKEISIDSGVHPDYRGKGYQTAILTECRDYLFKNNLADKLEMIIKNNNTGALRAAKKAKYKYLGKMGSYCVYQSHKNCED